MEHMDTFRPSFSLHGSSDLSMGVYFVGGGSVREESEFTVDQPKSVGRALTLGIVLIIAALALVLAIQSKDSSRWLGFAICGGALFGAFAVYKE